jgi:hypothetical protein
MYTYTKFSLYSLLLLSSISIKVFVREKNPQQKKERAAESFFMKLNTKPLKFNKMMMGGGGGGCQTRATRVPPLSTVEAA